MCYFSSYNNRSRKNMLLFKKIKKEKIEHIYSDGKWQIMNHVWIKNFIVQKSEVAILSQFRKRILKKDFMKLPHQHHAQVYEIAKILWMLQTNRPKYLFSSIDNMQNICYDLQYREKKRKKYRGKKRKKKHQTFEWTKRQNHLLSNTIFFALLHLSCMTNAQIENEISNLSLLQALPIVTNVPSSRPSTEAPTFTPSISTIEPTEMTSKSPSQYPTQFPSGHPSNYPSHIHTIQPSRFLSSVPSSVLTTSPSYLSSSSPSIMNSYFPSAIPTSIPSLTPSLTPSSIPSFELSNAPSTSPSTKPSLSQLPSTSPSTSKFPTIFPTRFPSISLNPSLFPTVSPSLSLEPTLFPTTNLPSPVPSQSLLPSNDPTIPPTLSIKPSSEPSLQNVKTEIGVFAQTFERKDNAKFQPSQEQGFVTIYNDLTGRYAIADRVETTCFIVDQNLTGFGDRRFLQSNTTFSLTLIYKMTYETRFPQVNISNHTGKFMEFMNNETNREDVRSELRGVGITIEVVGEVAIGYEPSGVPTMYPTQQPSSEPTALPSSSSKPSTAPSSIASFHPSKEPSKLPTMKPSFIPSTTLSDSPTVPPSIDYGSIFIGATSVIAGLLILFYAIYRIKKQKENTSEESTPPGGNQYPSEVEISDGGSPIQPTNSQDSSSSNFSNGESCISEATNEEVDKEGVLLKIFDSVKKDVSGSESSMPGHQQYPFITRDTLFDKYDFTGGNIDDYTWNGCTDVYGIEATALCKISDWKKRQQGANENEK